jgi:ribonuclease P protein component
LLPKIYRLKKKEDFRRIYQNGKSIADPYLVLYSNKTQNQKAPRIGFSVSKKIGNAVVRNKIKRRLRAAVKPFLTDINKEYDIFFIARGKIKGKTYQDVEKSIGTLLKKARLLNRNEA